MLDRREAKPRKYEQANSLFFYLCTINATKNEPPKCLYVEFGVFHILNNEFDKNVDLENMIGESY